MVFAGLEGFWRVGGSRVVRAYGGVEGGGGGQFFGSQDCSCLRVCV